MSTAAVTGATLPPDPTPPILPARRTPAAGADDPSGFGAIAASPLAVGDPIAALLTAYTSGRNGHTLTAYRRDLEEFRHFVGAGSAEEAVRRLLLARPGDANAIALGYRAHLSGRGLSPASTNRKLAALRSLIKLARLLGLVTWQIEVPGLRAEAYRDTRGPGVVAFRRLLAVLDARPDDRSVRRDRAAVRLLYDLGLRRGEAVSLDRDDVDLERGTVLVRGKRRTEKSLLSLPGPTRAALARWLEVRGDAPGPLFTSFDRAEKGSGRLTAHSLYRIVRALGAEAGITVAPHGLRHTAITEAIKAAQSRGIGLEEVLDFSRHKNVQVMMIYRDRDRDMQGQIASLVAEGADGGG
jgi:integrase/recombinase XerC